MKLPIHFTGGIAYGFKDVVTELCRKNEEQDFKGDDITHNKKETESERKKV